jgi:hypothetical protein
MHSPMESRGGTRSIIAAFAVGALLAGCGGDGDGAGAQGGNGNLGPVSPSPGPGTGTWQVSVRGAVPVSGNGDVSGSAGVSAVSGALRQIVIDGSGGGLAHRFTVNVDASNGIVFSVVHAWGASILAAEAQTQCLRTVTAIGQQACDGTVAVDLELRRVTFTATALRSGAFSSILNGQVPFTVP